MACPGVSESSCSPTLRGSAVVAMFLTTLFAYIGSLSPSAQVWCGDQYLKEVQATLAGKYRIGPSNRSRIRVRIRR